MTRSKHPICQSLAALATAALVLHSAFSTAQVRVARPQTVAPIQGRVSQSPPAAASVTEASARSLPMTPRAPLVASELGTLQPMMVNMACFPLNPTYSPLGLLPQGGFSSSPTTPYPQATWPANTNANEVINYVIQRAVLSTTSWTTVATTCGGSPSIWTGFNPVTRDSYRVTTFVDSSGGLLPATTYVYKITAIDQNNRTDWTSFQWTSQPVLPTVQVTNYQHSGSTITFTAAQFYNVAGQVVAPAQQLLVAPNNAPAFVDFTCKPGSYGLVCQVKMSSATSVALTFQWGLDYPNGFHVLAQSGITMPTP